MHSSKPVLNQCKAFLNMHTSYFKGKPFWALMAARNKRALTLNTPKVSDSKKEPRWASAAFVCRQMGFNGARAQAANDPQL